MSQTMNSNEWIEWNWTPEKPYPETLETLVTVMFEDDDMSTDNVSFWYGDGDRFSNNFASDVEVFLRRITHYRLA